MRFLLTFVLALSLSAGVASAQGTYCYGWEDNPADPILGGNDLHLATYSVTDEVAFEGNYSLKVVRSGASGVPRLYVAWIPYLEEGDVVTATLQTLDYSVGTNPSVRLWGHRTAPDGTVMDATNQIDGGSAFSGDADGWFELNASWTIPETFDGYGLAIQVRLYNANPPVEPLEFNWVDHLCVTIPNGRVLYFPAGVVGSQQSSLSSVKGLFK